MSVQPNLLVVDMEKLVSNMMWPDPRSQLARANGNGLAQHLYNLKKSYTAQYILHLEWSNCLINHLLINIY